MSTTKKESSARIEYIDFLKCIGLISIIIAHVNSPRWLMGVRSFDVPFMVILSSILCARSYRKYLNNRISSLQFYADRVKRLVIPTWIFLCLYFTLAFVFIGKSYDVPFYLLSFSLTRYGIGYVWIILIYLYSALLIPLYSKIKLSYRSILCIVTIYLLYELSYYFRIGTENKFIDTTFYYIIPYGVLTFLGYHYHKIKNSYKVMLILTSFTLFIGCGIYYWNEYGSFRLVSIAKYPPRIYYLAYGIAISFILLMICEKWSCKLYSNTVVRFISKNSLWIYLWHILVLDVYNFLPLPDIWYIKLMIVSITAGSIVFVVNKTIDLIETKFSFPLLKYLKG